MLPLGRPLNTISMLTTMDKTSWLILGIILVVFVLFVFFSRESFSNKQEESMPDIPAMQEAQNSL